MRVARRTLLVAALGAAFGVWLLAAAPLALASGTACNPSTSTLTTDQTSLPADGTWAANLTATCKDSGGLPLSGRTVFLVQSGGSSSITPATAVTNGSGVATFQATDGTPEGPITYRAADQSTGALWQSDAQVTFVYCDQTIVPQAAIGGGSLAVVLGGALWFVQRRRRRRHAAQNGI